MDIGQHSILCCEWSTVGFIYQHIENFVIIHPFFIFSGINISNNEAGGLHSAFPTWLDSLPILVFLASKLSSPDWLGRVIRCIFRSHHSLKFVSACLAVDPNSRSENGSSCTKCNLIKAELWMWQQTIHWKCTVHGINVINAELWQSNFSGHLPQNYYSMHSSLRTAFQLGIIAPTNLFYWSVHFMFYEIINSNTNTGLCKS